jgi:alpha-beta hydrolase superfamily lysophospholipase
MRRVLILVVSIGVIVGCNRPAPAPISGDWVGDMRHPAATMPLVVAVDSLEQSVKVSLRPWQLAAAPGLAVRRSDSLVVTVPAGSDTVRLQGVVRADGWVGVGAKGQESAPFDLRHLARLSQADLDSIIGTYRTADGGLVGVLKFQEFGERPMVVDYGSGRIGPLLPLSRDRFLLSRSVIAPIFPADTVVFVRGPTGGVKDLTLKIAGQASKTAPRLATRDEEVSFPNGDIQLAGTLTLPPGSGPFPALVRLHGSNAHTRGFMGPWVRFFAGLGFAVLAYDKRGTGRSTGDWKQADFRVLATDALAGVRALEKRTEIRKDRIGLWGISQAGWILPLVVTAAAPDEIAFMVVHSGSGTTVREQGRLNYRNELRAAGLPDSAIQIGLEFHRLDDSVTKLGRNLEISQRYYQAHKTQAPWLYQPAPLDAWFRTYYRMLMDYDPAESWRRVKIPVLLFFGELDVNVPPVESWPPIERGLAAAGNRQVTHYVLPGANHVLFAAKTGGRDEYPALNRFVPGYFDRMADWLRPFTR